MFTYTPPNTTPQWLELICLPFSKQTANHDTATRNKLETVDKSRPFNSKLTRNIPPAMLGKVAPGGGGRGKEGERRGTEEKRKKRNKKEEKKGKITKNIIIIISPIPHMNCEWLMFLKGHYFCITDCHFSQSFKY